MLFLILMNLYEGLYLPFGSMQNTGIGSGEWLERESFEMEQV